MFTKYTHMYAKHKLVHLFILYRATCAWLQYDQHNVFHAWVKWMCTPFSAFTHDTPANLKNWIKVYISKHTFLHNLLTAIIPSINAWFCANAPLFMHDSTNLTWVVINSSYLLTIIPCLRESTGHSTWIHSWLYFLTQVCYFSNNNNFMLRIFFYKFVTRVQI